MMVAGKISPEDRDAMDTEKTAAQMFHERLDLPTYNMS